MELFRTRAAASGDRVGAVVVDPDGGEVFALAADDVFGSASVIKIALVMTAFLDAAEGRLDLDVHVPVGERVPGSGVLSHLPGVREMSLRDLAAIAMSVSDNTATNRLIEHVGLERVNERLREWGCDKTRLRRAMYDLEAKARGQENEMTARETAALLRRVLTGAAAGGPLADVLRLLALNSDRTRLGRYLPAGCVLAHKDGWDTSPLIDNDAGVIRAAASPPGNGVIVAGFTNGVETREARSLLGLLGLAAAEVAGIDIGALPSEVARTA